MNLNKQAEETFFEMYGEAFVDKCNKIVNSIEGDDFSIVTLALILKEVQQGTYKLESFSHWEEYGLLCEVYEEYHAGILRLNHRINQISGNRGGKVVDGNITYNKTLKERISNFSISMIDEILLLCQALELEEVEFRIATGMCYAPLPNFINPHFSDDYDGIKGKYFYDLSSKMSRYYGDLLEKAGYPTTEKAKEKGRLGYNAHYGCEKYDFPEEYEKLGPVLSREEALVLLKKWNEEYHHRKKPYLSIHFHKDNSASITVNDVKLNELKKKGMNINLPQMRFPLNLSPDFFHGEYEETEEENERRYRFTVPATFE